MEKPKLWTRNFLSISFASFFIFLTFYMLMVTLPIYMTDELNSNGKDIGVIVTIFIVSAIIFRPFTGKWLDSIGPKKVLLFGVVIFLIGSFMYVWVNSLFFLLILRMLHGIGFGIATTSTSGIVANIIPNERRGEGMGYFATFMNLAMVIGPFVGLTVIHLFNYQLLFILSFIFSIFALVCSFLLKIPVQKRKLFNNNGLKDSIRLSTFFEAKAAPISIVAFILAFVYSGVLSFISIYAKELNLIEASSFFFVVYAVFLLLSRPFTGKWFDKFGENVVIYPSIIVFGLGIFLLSQAYSSFTLLLSGGLIGLGFGTITSSFQSIAVKSSSPHRRGLATSTFFVLFDSGFAFGSFLLGIISTKTNYAEIYLSCSIIAILSIVLYYLLHGRKAHRHLPSTNKQLSA